MNSDGWAKVALGELLVRIKDEVLIDDATTYTRLTIRLNGKGIVVRDSVIGADIGTKRQFVARAGQLVLSKIDAQNGAFGILPPQGDNAIITGNFWAFAHQPNLLDLGFLEYLTKTEGFIDFCRRASEGTTNRKYLQEPKFLTQEIPLPPLEEQRRIVASIDRFAAMIEDARDVKHQAETGWNALLRSKFSQTIDGVSREKMAVVAPLVRRQVESKIGEEYPELGIRSFGKGTFHKPALDYMSVGTKKLYRIEPGDLVFNNVFAWEGAIAVAQPQDEGRVGSHRFITCVPRPDLAVADFLCFYFLTPEGLEQIGEASPGGAGRNRTLGLNKLADIEVPVPPLDFQIAFVQLLKMVRDINVAHESTHKKLDAMLPSILDRAFKGEL